MRLISFTIKNFRNVPYRNVVCENLENNNYILFGKNMIGKTNMLNAIHWAFTGADLVGSVDNRANFNNKDPQPIRVELEFEGFKFARICEMVDDTPTVTIEIDGEKVKTVKAGEAMLHAKLGLTDLVLAEPKGFDIVKFLLNPLYFDTLSPSLLRKFMYMLSKTNFEKLVETQVKAVRELLEKRKIYDPYKLGDDIAKDIKSQKKIIDGCKVAMSLFPSIIEEATKKQKEASKELSLLENEDALANKYALNVSKAINAYYEKAMGIKVCLLEKGVGDDVFKDVCYPILPKSKLPFNVGSYAEKTLVAVHFINELTSNYNITPLPLLIDNMESLDANTFNQMKKVLRGQYIGACVREDD